MWSKKNKANTEYDPENPYAVGCRAFLNRYGYLDSNATYWKLVASTEFLVIIICVAVVLFMAQRVQTVPFVVQVDQHGELLAVQAADRKDDIVLAVNDRIIKSHLSNFVMNMRGICRDYDTQLAMLNRTYEAVADRSMAWNRLTEYFRENNPLEKSDTTVEVIIESVLPTSATTTASWQIDWSEETFVHGLSSEKHFYRGIFEIEINPPTTEEGIRKNPLGIFVNTYTMTEKK